MPKLEGKDEFYNIASNNGQVGWTPLCWFASIGNVELWELLNEEGAEIDAIDKGG